MGQFAGVNIDDQGLIVLFCNSVILPILFADLLSEHKLKNHLINDVLNHVSVKARDSKLNPSIIL